MAPLLNSGEQTLLTLNVNTLPVLPRESAVESTALTIFPHIRASTLHTSLITYVPFVLCSLQYADSQHPAPSLIILLHSFADTSSLSIIKLTGDVPRGPVVKTLPANAEDWGSSPGPERFHMAWGN